MNTLPTLLILVLVASQTLATARSTNTAPSQVVPPVPGKVSPLSAYQALAFVPPGQTNSALFYRYGKPDTVEPGRRYPLVVCLHGAGERGSDNTRQVGHFLPLLKAIKAATPCFVIIPQVPTNQIWATYGWSKKTESMTGNPSPTLDLTKQLIDFLISSEPVDANRIYITGLSMGGYGTWEAIQRWPDVFAAAIPICGGGDPALADKLTALPLWAWHGEADTVIPVDKTRRMIDAILAAGGHPRATYIPNCGHGSWGQAYKTEALATWLLQQNRKSNTPTQ